MSHTHTLPSGATVTIRDEDDVTYGDRQDVLHQLDIVDAEAGTMRTDMAGGDLLAMFERATIILAVESWTVVDPRTGEPLPVPSDDPDAIGRLRVRDGAMIAHLGDGLAKLLFPDFAPNPAADSPTTPSVASDMP